jgi:hypothetical protein
VAQALREQLEGGSSTWFLQAVDFKERPILFHRSGEEAQ